MHDLDIIPDNVLTFPIVHPIAIVFQIELDRTDLTVPPLPPGMNAMF